MRRAAMRLGYGDKVSDNGRDSVGGDVAGDDRDDFGLGALGSHTTSEACRCRSSRSPRNWTFLALCFVVQAMG